MSSKKKRAQERKTKAEARAEAAAALRAGKNPLFLPVVLTLAILPLIVHSFLVSVDPNEAALIGQSFYGDMFSQSKAGFLLAVGILMLFLGVVFRKKLFAGRSRVRTVYLISAGVFFLFTLLSSVLSKYPGIAFWGVHDRAEGFVTIACYLILLFYTSYAYRNENDFRHIAVALGIVTAVSAFFGVFQYAGHDLSAMDFAKAFLVSPWDQDKISSISIQFGAGKLWGTFYHYDYVGSFAAIAIPFFLVLAVGAKSLKSRVLLWGAELLSLWLLFGSTSRAGIIGAAAALIFCLVFFGKVLVRRWKISVSCLAAVILAVVGLNFATHGRMLERVPSLFSDISGVFENSGFDYRTQLPVRDVSSSGNAAILTTQAGDVLKASLSGNQINLTDGQGRKITAEVKNGKSAIDDKRFQRFGFSFVKLGESNELGLAATIDGRQQFYFRVDAAEKLQFTNPTGTEDIHSLASPPSFGFKGRERLGSSRGYIWSRANAMVPGNLILGSGPDTFVLNFPQNDLLGKYWAYGTTNMVVDKPHNLYLQTILGEGGIAFLAFLAMLLIYLVGCIRLYALKKEYGKNQIFGAAVCFGIVGYLFAGFFNDSVVSVAPVFWILLGVGIALNEINRKLKNGQAAPESVLKR